MHLGLRAFAELLTRCPDSHLQMVGRGPEEGHWRGLAARLGIEHAIEWTPWMARAEVAGLYARNDALLFPSLEDSVGSVVLEALSHGLPAICLNLGGPPIVVDEHCARVVEVRGRTADQVVHDLADAMHALATDAAELARMSVAARQRSRELSWAAVVAALYGDARAAPAT